MDGRPQAMPPGGSDAADAPLPPQLGPERPGVTRLPPVEPSPGSLAYLDFKNGFRDLKFHDPPTPDMVLTEDTGDLKMYVRPNDELGIGEATAKRIDYFFYKGRLSTVHFATKGFTNSRNVLEVLRQAYGIGERPNRFMYRYLWSGSHVRVSYDQNSITDDADVWFYSIPLLNEERTDQKAKA
jgi:hypothetical protein